jgi:hypothetical protein
VHPLELRNEVLVLFFGAQIAGRLAGGDDFLSLHEEGAGCAVDVYPAGKVLAVEHRHEAVALFGVGPGRRKDGEGEQQYGGTAEQSHGGSSVQGGSGSAFSISGGRPAGH